MTMQTFSPVYGPVQSWRYGRSLGIDAIGPVSTCSFHCVYCQLGNIEHPSITRQLFVPTAVIMDALLGWNWSTIDAITLSGSGEPTLAANLGAILTEIQSMSDRPLIVLTNGTLLRDASVQQELYAATEVSVKVDAVTPDRFQRISRPFFPIDWPLFCTGIQQFRQRYHGKLSLQTMIVAPWSEQEQRTYIHYLSAWQPDVIYLNRPVRPKPRQRLLAGRENLTTAPNALWFKPVADARLHQFATAITEQTGIPVRCAPILRE
ncbi:MAG: radical SAM protein [Cyanobacteria bacterium]|nr:radical SAM protein [Cyanobacteriota bacterium]MDW8203330.1 radical SAM protein [Cyanobacteriota bacterium SKYGB_h_bin112]